MSIRAVTPDAPAASHTEESSTHPHSEFLPTGKEYRMTGVLPSEETADEVKPRTEKETQQETPSDEGDVNSAAASEAAKTQNKEKESQEEKNSTKTAQSSESRWAKITRENRELREKNQRYERERLERESKRESQSAAESKTEGKTEKKADDKAAANPKPKIDDVDPKTGKPKYATYQDYEDARDDWNRKEAVREFNETSAKTAKENEQTKAQQEIAQAFAKKLDAAKEKHADFEKVALNPDLCIPAGSATDAFLLDSDHAGEVLYHLGQHPEILEGFYGDHDVKSGKFTNKISPQRQFRKLMEIEAEFSGASNSQAKSGTESGSEESDTGEKSSSSSSVKPITQAPRPPNQTTGKGAVTKDAVAQAVEEGDSETYMREQNARDLARRKKGK